jgi:hypothetical protein
VRIEDKLLAEMEQISEFFKLSSNLDSKTFRAAPKIDVPDINIALLTGQVSHVEFPLAFQQCGGSLLKDLVDTGFSGLYLISDRMKEVLIGKKLTGWRSYEIRLVDRTGVEIGGYSGLSILGRCGPIDISKSLVTQKHLTREGPLSTYYRGLFIGVDRWDGSDFFLPLPYYAPMVTAKAANVLRKANLSNISLENLSTVEINKMTAQLIEQQASAFMNTFEGIESVECD